MYECVHDNTAHAVEILHGELEEYYHKLYLNVRQVGARFDFITHRLVLAAKNLMKINMNLVWRVLS